MASQRPDITSCRPTWKDIAREYLWVHLVWRFSVLVHTHGVGLLNTCCPTLLQSLYTLGLGVCCHGCCLCHSYAAKGSACMSRTKLKFSFDWDHWLCRWNVICNIDVSSYHILWLITSFFKGTLHKMTFNQARLWSVARTSSVALGGSLTGTPAWIGSSWNCIARSGWLV